MVSNAREVACDPSVVVVNELSKLCADEPVKKENVRRNLFGGTFDSQAAADMLAQQVVEMAERARQIWNFDFLTQVPIKGGRYVWERVQDCTVPQYYIASGDYYESEDDMNYHFLNWNDNFNCVHAMEQNNVPSLSMEIEENVKSAQFPKPRLIQTSIKGYTRVQKRRSSKRLLKKRRGVQFLKGSSRVANYLLKNRGLAKKT